MNSHTITTTELTLASVPACDRCHRADSRGLAGWLGLRLCGLCLLMAKARWS